LASGTQRFLTYCIGEKNETKLKKVFATSLTLHFSFAVVFFLLLETVGLWFLHNKLSIPAGREHAAFWVFQLAIASTAAQIIQVPFTAVLTAREKFNIYAYMSIYDAVMKLLIVYLIQIGPFDKLIFYSTLFTIVSLSSTLIYNIYCRINFKECSISIKKFFDKSVCKEIGIFSGWNIMGCTAVLASGQGVNTLMNMFLGTLVNAARGISTQITSIINKLVSSFLVSVNPQIVKLYAERNLDEMFLLAMNASKFGAALMLLVGIPLIVEMKYVLTLWLGIYPDHTVFFSICAIVQAVIVTISRPLITILHATGKMKWPSIFSGSTLLLILPITYLLLRLHVDIDVIVCINVIPWLLELFTSLLFVKKYTDVNVSLFFPQVIFKVVAVSSITFITAYIIQSQMSESFFRLICVVFCNTIVLLLTVYYILLKKNDRAKVISSIVSKMSLFKKNSV
jgi:Na+-driven multidrug efflux pump